jgi:hypothetical protein
MRATIFTGVLALAACSTAADPASGPFNGPARIGGSPAAGSMRVTVPGSGSAASRVIAAPPERVWALLPAVYQELGITPGFVDERSRTVGNNDWELRRRIGGRANSAYPNCGTSLVGAAADLHRVRVTVRTSVLASGAGSEIATSLEGSATARDGGSDPTRCGSTGVLEERIATLLAERAKQPRAGLDSAPPRR